MYALRLNLPKHFKDEHVSLLAEGLLDLALSSAAMREEHNHKAAWVIKWFMQERPDIDDIIVRLSLQAAVHNISALIEFTSEIFEIEELADDINWLEKSYRDFAPFSIGPLFIHGSHYDGEVPSGKLPLQVDAATAFGSGEHETTNGCLQALLDLQAQNWVPKNVLDMGTGSGILALAAWKFWQCPIMGVDNDPESIIVTKRHAKMNGATIIAAVGDGFNTQDVNEHKPYDLIFANILAGPVIEMAPSLVRVLDKGGYCVLSGMLVEQSNLVLSAYEGAGLTYVSRYDIGEWTTLVLENI